MINDERFSELAHKALANEAQPAEQAELESALADNPILKKEFEKLGAEAAIAREILPLLEDIEYPDHQVPQPRMERLRMKVAEVFRPKREPGPNELLERLEAWASGARRAEAQQVREWLSLLRESLSGLNLSAMSTLAEGNIVMEKAFATQDYCLASEQMPSSALRPPPPMGQEEQKRAFELQNRLGRMEQRLREIEEMARGSRSEITQLLEELRRASRV